MNKKILTLGFFSVLLMVFLLWVFLSPPKVVEKYQIKTPLKKVEASQIDAIMKPYLGQSFWRLDLEKLHAQIVHLDWVYQASVTRRWPDEIEVRLEEQQPVVRWGQDGLLNKNGDIFYPKSIKSYENLVELAGSDSESKQLLADLVYFQKAFQSLGWVIDKMTLQSDDVWNIQFVKQPSIELDSADWQHKLSRFIEAYPKIKTDLRKNALLYDLRYSNGFVIKPNSDTQQKEKTSP